jgi:hypothetical protein
MRTYSEALELALISARNARLTTKSRSHNSKLSTQSAPKLALPSRSASLLARQGRTSLRWARNIYGTKF